MKRGFPEVQALLGGYSDWKEAGYPTEPALAPVPAPAPTPASSSSPDSSVDGLLSSDALTKGCQRSRPSGGFENVGLAVGESAIDFTLRDVDGNTFNLAQLLSEKPVVVIYSLIYHNPY